MKKTITFSLLFAASAICAYAGDTALETFYTSSESVTLDDNGQSLTDLTDWTDSDSADALVSISVSGANAGDKLAQIDFSVDFTLADGSDTDPYNLLSVVSSGGSAYSVSFTGSDTSNSRKNSLTVNLATGGEERKSMSLDFGKSAATSAAFSLTLTQGTDAGSVVVMLTHGTNAISFSSTNADLFTGDFSNIVIGGANATGKGAVTVTSIKARKAQSNDNNNDAVPEPTTATLSLLALVGLAARRRRCK